MRYYIIAMLFVIFDIEVIFIIPWAVRFQSLGLLASSRCQCSMQFSRGTLVRWKKAVT
jgi:NADH:ubiquinone oxidoreductase subunit 3 (subunit A)